MTMRDTMATRVLRGAINAVVILLLWRLHLARLDRPPPPRPAPAARR